VILKHNNPCGAAEAETLAEAYRRADRADRIAAFGGALVVNRALDQAARLVSHDALVVVITDGLGVDEQTLRLAARLQARNDLVWARVYDRLEKDLPDLGQVYLGDAETEMELNTSDRALIGRFGEQFESQMNWARNQALRAEVPYLAIDAAEEVLPQLRRVLGEGARP